MKPNKLFENGVYTGNVFATHFFKDITCNLSNYDDFLKHNNLFHAHTNAHISFILEGSYIESRKNKIYNRQAGDVFFCKSYEFHKFEVNKKFKNLNIEITNNFFNENNIEENRIENRLKNSKAKSNILKILFELQHIDNNIETSISLLLLDILGPKIQKINAVKPKWICTLEELISEKWNEKIELKEISDNLGIHPVTISKYFPKYFGYTFGAYLRQIKINKSIDLLKNTSLSITDITYQCGFSDQSHFIRTFKALNGFTPKQFRDY